MIKFTLTQVYNVHIETKSLKVIKKKVWPTLIFLALLAAIGFEAQKYIQDGKLVPDEVMIKFISSELRQIQNQSWLLDGKYLIKSYRVVLNSL